MKRKLPLLFFASILGLLLFTFSFPLITHAICPVCTVAALAGVGLSRWLGVDDTITGLWIGALIVSSALWTVNWLATKNIKFFGIKAVSLIFYYAAVFIPFWEKGIVGHPKNMLWGIDKLVLGTAVGSIFFYLSVYVYEEIKKNNGGHAKFPYQKIVIPISTLAILSLVFYFIVKSVKPY